MIHTPSPLSMIFVISSIAIIGGLVFAFFGYSTLRRTSKPKKTIDIESLLESQDIPDEVKEFLEEKIGWRKVSISSSRVKYGEIIEKLQEGKETLERMFSEGYISEKDYNIAKEEIERKIENLSR